MFKKLFFVIFILFLSSCAKENQAFNSKLYLQYIDSNFSNDFNQKILFAIQKINQDSGGTIISPEQNSEHQRPLTVFVGDSRDVLGHAEVIDYQCLVVLNTTNSIVNNTDPDQTDLRYVILHEVGHCYKRKHDTNPNSVMYPSFSGSSGLSYSQYNNLLSSIQSFANELLRNPYP